MLLKPVGDQRRVRWPPRAIQHRVKIEQIRKRYFLELVKKDLAWNEFPGLRGGPTAPLGPAKKKPKVDKNQKPEQPRRALMLGHRPRKQVRFRVRAEVGQGPRMTQYL